ncbi:MAG: PAS domain S-box protein [Desulfomonilaceae bacterium]
MKQESNTEINRSFLIVAFVCAVIIIISSAYIYYRHEVDRIRGDKYEDLASIANLKSEQIGHWRQDRIEDVERDVNSPLFSGAVKDWLQNRDNKSLKSSLTKSLELELKIRGYVNALLLDTNGEVLLAAQTESGGLNQVAKKALHLAMTTNSVVLSELYRSADGHVHLDTIAPVLDSSGQPIALLDLVIDASATLCKFLQSWPVRSHSSETLLVRKDGDDVLFLNSLRFNPKAALSLRVPLTDTSVPAVQVVLGKTGMFQGLDYRGVDVLADLRSIANSPWFIVTKVDSSEILAEARYRGKVIALFAVIVILSASGLTAYLFRVRQTRLYRELYRTEREKSETWEEFRTTLYSIGDGVVVTDRNGLLKLMNPVAEQLTGFTEKEANGKSLEEVFRIVNENTREIVQNPVQRVLKEGTVIGLANHTVLISKGGKEFPIADSGAPIHNKSGEVIGVVLVFRDQTEEREGQKALEQKHQELQSSLEHAAFLAELIERSSQPVGVSYLDQRLGFVNQAFCELVGYTKEELSDINWGTLTPPEWLRVEKERLRELRNGGGPVRYEKEYIRKDGSRVPVELLVHLGRDENGAPQYYYAFVDDITERKNAEMGLQREKEKLKNILDNMNDAVRIVNSNYEIEYVNKSMTDHFGAVMGRKCHDYFRGDLEPCVTCQNRNSFDSEPSHCEWSSEKIGKVYEIFDTPIQNADGSISRLGIFHDITRRKQIEEEKEKLQAQLLQSQKMEAIGTLAGGIAHDFNNLLQVILGYSELMLGQKKHDDSEHDGLRKIYQSAKSGAELVRRLMMFSRKIEPRFVALNLNEQINQAEPLLARTIPKMIDIKLELTDNIGLIKADPTQIEQIFLNLAVNARDAMPEGGVLTVGTATTVLDANYCRTHSDVRPGKYVVLTVKDTGQGMNQETAKRIFEPFFTTKELGKGTGLGLAVVYGIVQQHGGYIWCYSEPDKGAVFKVYFPAFEPKESLAEQWVESPLSGGRETILVVDDDQEVRSIIETTLTNAGYTVLTAVDGKDAIARYQDSAQKIGLVVLDLMMPKMGGMECLKRLLTQDRKAKVIIASGYLPEGGVREYLELGARGFIEKPYESKKLLETVRTILDSD